MKYFPKIVTHYMSSDVPSPLYSRKCGHNIMQLSQDHAAVRPLELGKSANLHVGIFRLIEDHQKNCVLRAIFGVNFKETCSRNMIEAFQLQNFLDN